MRGVGEIRTLGGMIYSQSRTAFALRHCVPPCFDSTEGPGRYGGSKSSQQLATLLSLASNGSSWPFPTAKWLIIIPRIALTTDKAQLNMNHNKVPPLGIEPSPLD